jgi:hypothetical protein
VGSAAEPLQRPWAVDRHGDGTVGGWVHLPGGVDERDVDERQVPVVGTDARAVDPDVELHVPVRRDEGVTATSPGSDVVSNTAR